MPTMTTGSVTVAFLSLSTPTLGLSFNNPLSKLFQNAVTTPPSPPTATELPHFEPLGKTTLSWDDLERRLAETSTVQSMEAAIKARAEGAGSAHTDTKLRLFGTSEEPRVTLYRDQAGWCPYCQKVWLLLEEKQIPYKVEKVPMRSYGDKPKWFLDKVPSGLLPVIELDGKMITESLVIMQILDETFPGRPLLPTGDEAVAGSDPTASLAAANELLRLERELFSWWCQLTFRPSGPFGGGAQEGFEECLDKVEVALSRNPDSPWLLDVPTGGPSLVDLQYISHVERMTASVLYWKGINIRNRYDRWPSLERWFRAFESRPAYIATKSDYYTHVQDIPPQYGPGFSNDASVPFAKAIDGKGAGAQQWTLPLPPLTADSVPEPYFIGSEDAEGSSISLPVDEVAARLEAAFELSGNHAAVCRFALRGAGKNGFKRFQAPLADPYATPNEDLVPEMDLVLRAVATLLVDGDGSGDAAGDATAAAAIEDLRRAVGAESAKAALKVSLAYLRDRVGVPRDMSYPAARQFRAHLNWAYNAIDGQ